MLPRIAATQVADARGLHCSSIAGQQHAGLAHRSTLPPSTWPRLHPCTLATSANLWLLALLLQPCTWRPGMGCAAWLSCWCAGAPTWTPPALPSGLPFTRRRRKCSWPLLRRCWTWVSAPAYLEQGWAGRDGVSMWRRCGQRWLVPCGLGARCAAQLASTHSCCAAPLPAGASVEGGPMPTVPSPGSAPAGEGSSTAPALPVMSYRPMHLAAAEGHTGGAWGVACVAGRSSAARCVCHPEAPVPARL